MLALARRSTFASLESPALRQLLGGVALAYVADSVAAFGVSWLVVDLARREGAPERVALYLALVSVARFVPALTITPLGGAILDRVDRRTMLRVVVGIGLAEALVLFALAELGLVSLGALAVLTLVSASVVALELPALYASLPRLVPQGSLMSAIGLTNIVGNATELIGPLIGGALVTLLGTSAPFVAAVPLYLIALAAIWRLPALVPAQENAGAGLLALLRGGFEHIAEDRLVVTLLAISTLLSFLGRAVTYLYAAVVTDVLGLGALELSWLLAARAIGALSGSFLVASLGGVSRRALAAGLCIVVFGLALFGFGLQRTLPPALVLAAICGGAQYLYSGLANTMLQERTIDHARGRVMSVYTTTTSGPQWVGMLALGAAGAVIGIGPAVAVGGAVLALAGVLAIGGVREMREYRARLGA